MEILGKYKRPADIKSAIEYEVKNPHFDFGPGQRHAMEVDFHIFRKELKSELKKAGVDIGKSLAGNKNLEKSFA
jgi:hypothetical protein